MKHISFQQIALTIFIFLIAVLSVGSAVFKSTIWVGSTGAFIISSIVLLAIGKAITR